MKRRYDKTGELNGSSYTKTPWRSNAILILENLDKYFFLGSTLANLHPCENNHPTREKNYRHIFKELNIEGFGFSNGFKCSDVHKIEELNTLSKNKCESTFSRSNKWKHNWVPIEISKNKSDRVVESMKYKNP